MAGTPRLFFLLNLAQGALRKRADRTLRRQLDVSSAQVGALFFVESRPGCLQRELAAALGQHDSAATGMVGRMEEAGLLRRRPSERDRRAWALEATPRGRRVLRRVRPLLDELNAALGEGFGPDELAVVARFLERARDLGREETGVGVV